MKYLASKFLDSKSMMLCWIMMLVSAVMLLLVSADALASPGLRLPMVSEDTVWQTDLVASDPSWVSPSSRHRPASHFRNSRLCSQANGNGAVQPRLILLVEKDETINRVVAHARAYPAYTRQYTCDRLRSYTVM